ncbi:hypothetical protein P4S68_22465 [Pseudoalteromonas sp. Hal099]
MLENTDFTDSSETLLDPEDAQEEYTDDTLKVLMNYSTSYSRLQTKTMLKTLIGR